MSAAEASPAVELGGEGEGEDEGIDWAAGLELMGCLIIWVGIADDVARI